MTTISEAPADANMAQKPDAAPSPTPVEVKHRPREKASYTLMGLLVLACFYTLYFASELFLPITIAIVLYLTLSPVIRKLHRWRIPPPLSAGVIVFVLVGSLVVGAVGLSGPIAEWRYKAPYLTGELQAKLEHLKEPVQEVQKASKQVERMTEIAEEGQPQEVVVKQPSLVERLAVGLQTIGVQLAMVVVLLYFLMAYGEIFLEKLIKILPRLRDKKVALTIARQVEREVSTYLFTITLINIGLGVAIGLSLYSIGLPSAVLWGVMATLLNYIPYIGALTGATIVGLVGLMTYDTGAEALLPPAIYMALTILEGQFITPSLLGRRFTLNPVIIFIAILLWSWLWSIPGAFLAVPILVVLKALSDHIEPLDNFGEFLRGRSS